MKQKKIIYILGAGRSGTTLLEIILGNAHNIFNAGELNRYPYRDGIAKDREPGSLSYQFWDEIRSELKVKHDLIEQEILHKKFEYHDRFIKNILGFRATSNDYGKYQAFLRDLYALIFNKIDVTILTDSSKYPGRAVNLSETLDYEISYIYIKRDPVNVVRSFAKRDVEQDPKGWLPANLYYFIANALCRLALQKLRKKHQIVTIKYEDLIQLPVQVISLLETKLNLDLQKIKNTLSRNEYLNVSPFIFDANRIRLKSTLKIQPSSKEESFKFSDHVTRVLNLFHYR